MSKGFDALLRMIGLCVGLMIATGNARADSWKDCNQDEDQDLSIQGCTEIISRGPNAVAYSNRGLAYTNQGNYDRAIADETKSIEIAPEVADAYNNRAWTYFKAGKAAQGLPDAQKAVELAPNDPDNLDTRGNIFEALGRREEAIADYRRAVSKWDADSQGSKDALKRLGAAP